MRADLQPKIEKTPEERLADIDAMPHASPLQRSLLQLKFRPWSRDAAVDGFLRMMISKKTD